MELGVAMPTKALRLQDLHQAWIVADGETRASRNRGPLSW